VIFQDGGVVERDRQIGELFVEFGVAGPSRVVSGAGRVLCVIRRFRLGG
jgi:phage baseplate assembly protein gpV